MGWPVDRTTERATVRGRLLEIRFHSSFAGPCLLSLLRDDTIFNDPGRWLFPQTHLPARRSFYLACQIRHDPRDLNLTHGITIP